MFKKTDPEPMRPEGQRPEPEPRPAPVARGRDAATIGPSISLRGDMTGEEDLVIQGSVEGTISLRTNLLTIGKDGHISATVNARVIVVEGKVEGDLNGEEQVILKQSANVQGNIVAPRVTLEDGCHFKGSIDMDVRAAPMKAAAPARPANVAEIKQGPGEDAGKHPATGGDQHALLK